MTLPQHWHTNRFVEEMGEAYYYIMLNGEFFAKCPSEEIADMIIAACSRPLTEPDAALKFSSEDLLLIAHDEWKRREERKHLHEESTWVSGFINGFCTDKKWARGWLDKIHNDAAPISSKVAQQENNSRGE